MGHYHYTLLILNKPKKKLPCHAVSLFWLIVIESCLGSIRSHQSWSLALKGSSQSLAAAMLRNHTTSLLVPNRRPGAGVRECVRCFARSLPKARQLLEEVLDQIAGCSSTVECKLPPGTMSRATEIRRPATKHFTDFPVPIKAQLAKPKPKQSSSTSTPCSKCFDQPQQMDSFALLYHQDIRLLCRF